ncbi:hypothetical protein SSX86_009634 [Deinandra increscens subsp. villosa]|uniref:Ubiquitin-like protease family profile domain-containing protein n=1 Tax=Deinandra increscens subsp. villosa TaxID=3103831 RepID=A0AAP0D9G7_9ASTR
MIESSDKFKVFSFDESVPEENPFWTSSVSAKKKSRCVDSGTDCYRFLETYAGGMPSRGKKLRNEIVILNEVDDAMNERICRSDAALQSSSSNYSSKTLSQSKCSDNFISHKDAIDRKDSDRNQRLRVADKPISIISDEDIDNSSTMCSSEFADAEGEQVLEQETTSLDEESSVVVYPECVTYGRSCFSKAKLTFFRSSIKLDVSEEGAIGCLTFEWKTQNILSIESRELDPLITAEVCLLIKPEHGQKSGILEVKFTLADPCWSNKQDQIKSLDEQYKEKWDVDLDSCELFEDITYMEGDCDSITISKRDFQLLQPEKFINDTIVDFYIEYLKKITPSDARVHFFNSFFFRKLADFDENQSRSVDSKEAFQRVRKWTKKVNIFQKDYIFIPVNFRLHWSLIIICHPGEVVDFTDDELEISSKVPCILHLDSIKGSHRGLEQCIKCYVWEEWKERNNNTPEDISTKFKDLRFLRLEAPQQENSYDCGLFMLHYMELFVKQASNNFNPINTFIDKDWFYPMEASLKRSRIRRLIFELTKSNTEQFLSPKSSFELKDEDDEEEEADVQILNDTCNSKEACCESISDTCANESGDVPPLMVKPLRSEHMDKNLLDGDLNGGSSIADDEQKNQSQIVLYDPSINDVSPIKKNQSQMVLYNPSINDVSPIKKCDETEDIIEKQALVAPDTNKINPIVTCIDNSMNRLQLKDKSAGGDDMFEPHVLEDSDDDDDDVVFETCVVEDSDPDRDSDDLYYICHINSTPRKTSLSLSKDVAEVGYNVETSKRRQRRPACSVGRKRPRRSS